MIDSNFFSFNLFIISNIDSFKKFGNNEIHDHFLFSFSYVEHTYAKKEKEEISQISTKTNFAVFFVADFIVQQFFSRIFCSKQDGRRWNNSKALLEIFPVPREKVACSDRFEIVEGLYLELSTHDNNNFGRSCSLAVYAATGCCIMHSISNPVSDASSKYIRSNLINVHIHSLSKWKFWL